MGSDVKKAYGAAGRDELLWFEPETLVVVEDTAHALYDERTKLPVDERLVRNIMVRGVLEPVIVRKNGDRDGVPVVEIVDGRQRVRAAREANARLEAEGKERVRVPAVRMRGSDGDLFGVMVSANEIRRDDTPLVRARKLARYLGLGHSVAEAMVTFGVTGQTIRAWTSLLECSTEVHKAVEKGQVAATIAIQLSKLPREDQAPALAKLLEAGPVKGRQAERAAAAAGGKKAKQRMLTRKEVEGLRDTFVGSVDEDGGGIPSAIAALNYVLKGEVPKKWQARA